MIQNYSDYITLAIPSSRENALPLFREFFKLYRNMLFFNKNLSIFTYHIVIKTSTFYEKYFSAFSTTFIFRNVLSQSPGTSIFR